MKNKFFTFIVLFFSIEYLYAENLLIEAQNITLDKDREISIFKDNVNIETSDKKITSQFAEFNKKTENIILKNNIILQDKSNNLIKAEFAEYNNLSGIFKSTGDTFFESSDNYILKGADIYFNNKNKNIKSNKPSILTDLSGNKIYLENFEYIANKNIFKSVGQIKIIDKFENSYEFSQIYIDTKKKELLGTDIKAFLNSEEFKINKKNDPRVFANTMRLTEAGSSFNKSIFTICELKEDQKCPPWTLRSSEMTHDKKSKTIYYDNAVVKIYDIPILYLPFLSHPDPSVDRRSGFLNPSFSDTKNLGAGISVPYFWALAEDKNFTLTNRLFVDEHPIFFGEYHQAFKNSNFLADFGYTEGYKKTSATKKAGDKSHFFSKFTKNFSDQEDFESTLNITTQNVSNRKYLKLYKIKSNLVDYNKNTLENSIDYTYSKDDLFFGFNMSVYETLNDSYNDKYEYILPNLTFDKNIFSKENFGDLDFQSNLKANNYDTNKNTNFFINQFDFESIDLYFNSKIKNNILGKLKNINYETKNISLYKEDTTYELFGAVGLLSEMEFQKTENNVEHYLTPKTLLKLSPGSMRQEESGSRLTVNDAFSLNRSGNSNSFETGNTLTLGFDYSVKTDDIEKFNFSVAQIINEKENKKLHSKTSLDEKLSDLVGGVNYSLNENFKFDYQFALDQNYQDFNYNEIGTNIKFNNIDINFDYIQESKHIGDQEYLKTKVNFVNEDKSRVSFETKRNLITNSSEFYDLSYEYLNDCLRAGLVFRREFYNDSELEPENSLMFNITIVPFGSIEGPKINK